MAYQHEEHCDEEVTVFIRGRVRASASAGVASAQTTTTTTTTWTPQEGTAITQYSTTQHYQAFSDPSLQPSVGAVLPPAVTVFTAAADGGCAGA